MRINLNRILFLSFLFITVSGFLKQEKDKMKSFSWLLGDWRMPAGNSFILENWRKADDSTLSAGVYRVRNGDTTLTETVQLVYRNHAYAYIPRVKNQNEGKPVTFVIEAFDQKSFIAVNPAHDFPRKISYTLDTENSIHAFIDDGTEKPVKRFDFYYSRIK